MMPGLLKGTPRHRLARWALCLPAAALALVYWPVDRPLAQAAQQAARPPSAMTTVRLNRAIELLEQGKSIIAIPTMDFSLANARMIASSDADFTLLDIEHGSADWETLQIFLLGMTNKAEIAQKGNLQPNVPAVLRLPQYGYEPITHTVKKALDLGFMGLVFPAIGNKEEAIRVVSAARYPQARKSPNEPLGRRGVGPTMATWLWGVPNYAARAGIWPLDRDGELLLLVQIETLEGVRNIDEILDVPGVGGTFVGPGDLGNSLRSEPGAPDLEAAIQTVLKSCLAKKVPCGIAAPVNRAAERIKQGFRIIILGSHEPDGPSARFTEGLRAARAAAAVAQK